MKPRMNCSRHSRFPLTPPSPSSRALGAKRRAGGGASMQRAFVAARFAERGPGSASGAAGRVLTRSGTRGRGRGAKRRTAGQRRSPGRCSGAAKPRPRRRAEGPLLPAHLPPWPRRCCPRRRAGPHSQPPAGTAAPHFRPRRLLGGRGEPGGGGPGGGASAQAPPARGAKPSPAPRGGGGVSARGAGTGAFSPRA